MWTPSSGPGGCEEKAQIELNTHFFSSAIFKFLRGLPHADIELAYPKILDIGPKLIQFCMLRRISTFPFYKYVPVVSVVLLSISFVVICLFAQTPLDQLLRSQTERYEKAALIKVSKDVR